MKAVFGNRMPQRLLLSAMCLALAAAFLVDPVLASAEEIADNGVVVTVEIAPGAPAPAPEELPATGAMVLAPAAVATVALLGGALLLSGRRRARSALR